MVKPTKAPDRPRASIAAGHWVISAEYVSDSSPITKAAIAIIPLAWPSTPLDQLIAFIRKGIQIRAKTSDQNQICLSSPNQLNINLGWLKSITPPPMGLVI